MFNKKTCLILTALFSFSAHAHNVWVEPVAGENQHYVVKFGHTETETYAASKLKSVQLISHKGENTAANYNFKNGEAYFNANNNSLVLIEFDNGVWSKLPSGKYVEKTKAQEPTALESTNPVKMGKAILKWDEQAFKTQGTAFELIPQSQPQVGKPLSILVLQNGKPVQGIKVGLGEDQAFNLSDEKGIAEFTPTQGANKVWAEFKQKVSNNPDYDVRSIEYLLSFELN
ncbi:nickel transport protein [Mesocricetibacter intestinalis]|uniref:Nickel transport protein n=1 Tax=Mesocricetibacter intestinalis TaxID=1521930 RepID=A0A4R6VCA7_9PAST|nr:DUF4198 domain-containing protein [Mesocricetibacter intestinalis]TDQ57903.1 nickel transport protein [Mesocricetibacter intestinalis]